VVSVLDSGAEGSRNAVGLTVHTHRASVHQAAKLVAALLRVAGVTSGLAESNGGYRGFMARVTCRLTVKNRDQLPTLGNRVLYLFTHRMRSMRMRLLLPWCVCMSYVCSVIVWVVKAGDHLQFRR